MERKDLISIIIPVYNAEKFLAECIDSVLKQTYKRYELILIDDGSTDTSWEIIERYTYYNAHIKGIQTKNGGPNSARKKGLEIATGEFVMFIDADDYVDKHICEKLIRSISMYKVDIVIPRLMKTLDGINIGVIGRWPQEKYPGIYAAENMIDQDVFYKANMPLGIVANLYRTAKLKKIFEKVEEEIRFSEDFSCHILALLDSKYVYFLDECLYYYQQNSNSLMHNHINSNFESEKHLYHFLMPELKKRHVSPKVYKQLEWIIIFSLLIGGYETFRGKNYLYPFRNVRRESKIIIYGAGVFGRAIYDFVNQYHLYNIILWVDRNYIVYQEEGFPVYEIEKMDNLDFDHIVIALLKVDVAAQVKTELEKKGIRSEKIEMLDQELISYKELPQSFWAQ